MPLKGFNFVKTLVTFGIIQATDSLLQNMTKIVCLRCLTFDIFYYKPLQTVLNNMGQFYEISIVYTRFISETKTMTPNFFCISGTGNSLSTGSKNIKKFYRQENFRANVLKPKVQSNSSFLVLHVSLGVDTVDTVGSRVNARKSRN